MIKINMTQEEFKEKLAEEVCNEWAEKLRYEPASPEELYNLARGRGELAWLFGFLAGNMNRQQLYSLTLHVYEQAINDEEWFLRFRIYLRKCIIGEQTDYLKWKMFQHLNKISDQEKRRVLCSPLFTRPSRPDDLDYNALEGICRIYEVDYFLEFKE